MADAAHETIRRDIAMRATEQVEFLQALVQQPTDNPPGDCEAHAVVAAEHLTKLGFEVERHQVPADVVATHGMISVTNLIVRRRYGDGPVIALNAHGDVVPPGEGWSVDPYGGEVRDGALYGRGAAVSKSDFTTYGYALLALDAFSSELGGAVEIHITYDEETGGAVGPRWLLDQGLTKPDFAICAGFSYGIVNAHNGCLHLEVTVRGKIAHAALPERGHDALEAANTILTKLYAYRRGLSATTSAIDGIGSPTMVVGLISGGINTNVVPDSVSFRIDRRIIPEEDATAAENELRAQIGSAAAGLDGIQCEVTRILLAEPLAPLPGCERLTQLITAHGERVFKEKIATHGVPLYTDARHYAKSGVPSVLYGSGPRSIEKAGGHGADEHVQLDDLMRATEVIACTLHSLLTED